MCDVLIQEVSVAIKGVRQPSLFTSYRRTMYKEEKAPGWELVLEIRRKRYGNVGVLGALEGAENAIESVKH